ncbi:MAG: hypothetical protein MJZ11_01075 [Lachnospiraceae bacterium]|nr:hypothetical protein [Lachnospiraceae bacterium]
MSTENLRLIANIIAYLGFGFSFGFIVYSFVSSAHKDIRFKSFVCLILSAITLLVLNFNIFFGVKITIPKELTGNTSSSYMVKTLEGNSRVKEIIYNVDGSVTLTFGAIDRYLLLHSLKKTFNEELDKLLLDDNLKIYELDHNSDFTEFNVKIIRKELTMTDTVTTLLYYAYGEIYNIVKGTDFEDLDITVTFISALNDEVLEEYHLNDQKEKSESEASKEAS